MKGTRDIEIGDFRELNKDEAREVMNTKEFESFLDNSSRFIERALGQEFNIRGDFFVEA